MSTDIYRMPVRGIEKVFSRGIRIVAVLLLWGHSTVMNVFAIAPVEVLYDNGTFSEEFVPSGVMADGLELSTGISIKGQRQLSRTAESLKILRVIYSPKPGGYGWGGIYWQHPANNWGTLPGSTRLIGKNELSFWVKGTSGTELFTVKVGGIGGEYADWIDYSEDVRASRKWEKKVIVLQGDLSRVIGALAIIIKQTNAPRGMQLFFHDIKFQEPGVVLPETVPDSFTPQKISFVEPERTIIYSDFHSSLFSPTGWMGNTSAISYEEACRDDPFQGKTCIRISYSAATGWGGIYWQYPPKNWGSRPGYRELAGRTRLVFSARGKGTIECGFGGITDGRYKDSGKGKIRVRLRPDWHVYRIPLQAGNLNELIGGFFVSWDAVKNFGGIDFYLDEIYYE